MIGKNEKEWDALKALRSRPSSMYQEERLFTMRDISTKVQRTTQLHLHSHSIIEGRGMPFHTGYGVLGALGFFEFGI